MQEQILEKLANLIKDRAQVVIRRSPNVHVSCAQAEDSQFAVFFESLNKLMGEPVGIERDFDMDSYIKGVERRAARGIQTLPPCSCTKYCFVASGGVKSASIVIE